MKFYFWLMRVLGTPLNSELQADASVAFVLFPALSVTCSRVSLLCGPLTPSKPNPPPPLTAVHLCFLDFPARSPCSVPAQPWILPHWSSFLAHTSWGLIHRLQTLWHLMCFQTCCSESWSSWKSGSVSKETASAILTVSHLRTTGGGGGAGGLLASFWLHGPILGCWFPVVMWKDVSLWGSGIQMGLPLLLRVTHSLVSWSTPALLTGDWNGAYSSC